MPNAHISDIHPILAAIQGFSNNYKVDALVDEQAFWTDFSLENLRTEGYINDNCYYVDPKYIRFFGYKEACLENKKNYPNTIYISFIEEKIKAHLEQWS